MPGADVITHPGGGTAEPLQLDSAAASMAQARQVVTGYLDQHCRWADRGAVVLVLSELLANAVRHAANWWLLHVSGDDHRLDVEVHDRSDEQPRMQTPQLNSASGGLGMHIVTRLSSQLRVEAQPGGGKLVRATWFRGERPQAWNPATGCAEGG